MFRDYSIVKQLFYMKEKEIIMKYIVYITKNLVNNKRYIGVHKTENPEIFDGYLGNSVWANYPSTYNNPKYPFQLAVKKYGPSKFIRSVIKVFNDPNLAYKLEAELVTEEIVKSKEYYNVSLGGKYPHFIPKTIYQYSINGKYLKEWSCDDAAKFYSVAKESFSSSIRNKQKLAGFYWSYNKIDQLNMKEYSNPNIPKTVYQYSEDGVCIGVYESLNQTENPGRICTAIQTRRKYKNCYYSYTLYEEYKPKISQSLRNMSIFIYNKDGSFFTEVIGVTNAMKAIKGKSRESIYNAINTGKPYKGFKFLLYKEDKIEPFKLRNESKPVLVFDLYGNFLKEYLSINSAIKDLKLDNSSANRVLKGTQHQTKGYILKYKE